MKSIMLPESCYKFKALSFDEVSEACAQQKTITCWVEEILEDEERFLIKLGNNLYGYLPFSEATIYPFRYSSNPSTTLPIQIFSLEKKLVRAKVTSVDNTITLSRKANMEKAFEYLKKCSKVYFHITSTSGTIAFGDAGDGLTARIHLKDVCRSRIRNISEYFHKGDKLWLANLGADEGDKRFNLSYKKIFPKYNPDSFSPGDAVNCTINEPLDDMHTAYFVTVSPQVTGIMNCPDWIPDINYGNKVQCYVVRATEKGLKLRFAKFIEN